MSYDTLTVIVEKQTTKNLIHKGVDIRDGMYGMLKHNKDGGWDWIPLGGAVYVDSVIIDLDTAEDTLLLYVDKKENEAIKRIYIRFPREDLTETKILGLKAYGVQVNRTRADILIQTLENQEHIAEKKYMHNKLGFGSFQDKSIFKGFQAIGVESAYSGKLRIKPEGTYETWKDMVLSEVIGHTPLEFMLGVGISGLLVDFLKEDFGIENVMCHCVGESSSGKTTAALLSVSCGSAPDFLGNNFVFNFQDTLNSLMKLIPNSYSVLIDEGSLLNDRDMTQMMYSLSSGVEKRRLNQTMDVVESKRFRTALVMTSEKSILSQCNKNTGLLVRNMEFVNVRWTKSAESADKIKKCIQNNYGLVVPYIAEYILKTGKKEIVEMMTKEIDAIVMEARNKGYYNNLTERAAKQVALILVSVELINKVMHLNLNKTAINEFIQENSIVNNIDNVSIGVRAMEWLMQYCYINTGEIYSKLYDTGSPVGSIGELDMTDDVLLPTGEISKYRLYIVEKEFERILREGKFCEKQIILKEWKEKGYLVSQKDRYLSRLTRKNMYNVKGYIIQLPYDINKEGIIRRGEKKCTNRLDFQDDEEENLDELFSWNDEEEKDEQKSDK